MLMAADRLLAKGKGTAAVCRELKVSQATYHRSHNQYGCVKAEEAERLKTLERENAARAVAGRGEVVESRARGASTGKLPSPQRRRAAAWNLTLRRFPAVARRGFRVCVVGND